MKEARKKAYKRPELRKIDNIKAITFECPQFQCSVTVPAAPPAP